MVYIGLYRGDDGKENRNYYFIVCVMGLYWVYIGLTIAS